MFSCKICFTCTCPENRFIFRYHSRIETYSQHIALHCNNRRAIGMR